MNHIRSPRPDLAALCYRLEASGSPLTLAPLAQYIPTMEFYASMSATSASTSIPCASPATSPKRSSPQCATSSSSPSSHPTPLDHRNLVDLVDVKLGHEYELVVTGC
jgi:hypothetical protein